MMERRFTGYEQTFNVGKNVSSGTIRLHGDTDEQNTTRPVVYWRVTSWSTPHPVSVKAEYTRRPKLRRWFCGGSSSVSASQPLGISCGRCRAVVCQRRQAIHTA